MADKPQVVPLPGELATSNATTAKAPPAIPRPQGNPAFQAMGLPNWRLKLPSRNWMIFIGIVGTWTGTLVYDRNQKKKAQQKWCTLVSHIAQEPLQTNTLARRVTVYLAAPPGDSLRTTREHFLEYVKPVLVAAALDWDVVEGRREGEIRAATAERIRKFRRKQGEQTEMPEDEDATIILERLRSRIGVQEWTGQRGDIVIGRHTWKEYIRGLHEGWLGALEAPAPPPPAVVVSVPATVQDEASPTITSTPIDSSSSTLSESSPSTPEEEQKKPDEPPPPPPKPLVTPPYNIPSSYPTSSLPPSITQELSASNPIQFPHILGFLNTPIRIYRFLTRRYVADDIGRQTAAIVLASHRAYHQSASVIPGDSSNVPIQASGSTLETDDVERTMSRDETWEQQRLLSHEEREWTKASRKRSEGDGERVWLDDIVIDPRIGSRMRRFELDAEDEDRARRIGKGMAGIPGRRMNGVEEKATSES